MPANRSFSTGLLIHCYQNTREGFLIFHTVDDCLVFFTYFCIASRRHHIRVISLCLMPDHVHFIVTADTEQDLSAFVRDYTSWFVKDYNHTWHHSGPFFNTPFGSAVKRGDKAARTNIIYVGNNPVERRLSTSAEEYRWNFLSYYNNPSPYSAHLVIRKASFRMRSLIYEIKSMHSKGRAVSYAYLRNAMSRLDSVEKNQLADYIIRTYSVIDYDYAIRFFDTRVNMLAAMKYNTGSEYDINETFVGRSDTIYRELSSYIMMKKGIKDIHDILDWDERDKIALANELHTRTGANPIQIAKFLHLKRSRQRLLFQGFTKKSLPQMR